MRPSQLQDSTHPHTHNARARVRSDLVIFIKGEAALVGKNGGDWRCPPGRPVRWHTQQLAPAVVDKIRKIDCVRRQPRFWTSSHPPKRAVCTSKTKIKIPQQNLSNAGVFLQGFSSFKFTHITFQTHLQRNQRSSENFSRGLKPQKTKPQRRATTGISHNKTRTTAPFLVANENGTNQPNPSPPLLNAPRQNANHRHPTTKAGAAVHGG